MKSFYFWLVALNILNLSVSYAEVRNEMGADAKFRANLSEITEANRKSTLTHFSRRDHVGLELIVANGTNRRIESIGGHSLLRLIDTDTDPTNDTVINLIMAPVQQSEFETYIQGFQGKIPFFVEVTNFATILNRYSASGMRSLRRTVIPSSPGLISQIKNVVIEVQNVPYFLENYNFLKNNCLSGLMKILSEAGYPSRRIPVLIPELSNSYLKSNLLAFSPEIIDANLIATLENLWEKFHFSLKSIQNPPKEWEDRLNLESFWNFVIFKSSDREFAIIAHLLPQTWVKIQKRFLDSPKPIRPDALRAHSLSTLITPIDPALYKLCELKDMECRRTRWQKAVEVFGLDYMQKVAASLWGRWQMEWQRSKRLSSAVAHVIQTDLKSPIALDMISLNWDAKNF